VPCYNRQIEFRSGRNAKGTKPTIFLPERCVGVILGTDDPGERPRIDVTDEFTADMIEIMVQILKVTVGRVASTTPTYGETMTMGEFTRFMAAHLPAKPQPQRRLLGAARGRRPS